MKKQADMRLIKLDACEWKTVSDFYSTILPALGAPKWHGDNVNALVESMVYGEINDVEPPYRVEIHSTKNLPHKIKQELNWTAQDTIKARNYFRATRGHDVEVEFKIID